ncbi:hypothetical protein BDZ91DRAFT_802851 [Kalaharituber pfeilii]|nr:hypothetical protein BDZ91DRAFT_802851 [Kalaharituber pfeilii]
MSLLELLCCLPISDSSQQQARKLVISSPTLIHGGEATRNLNLVDVKLAARERVNSGGSSMMTMTTVGTTGGGSDGVPSSVPLVAAGVGGPPRI